MLSFVSFLAFFPKIRIIHPFPFIYFCVYSRFINFTKEKINYHDLILNPRIWCFFFLWKYVHPLILYLVFLLQVFIYSVFNAVQLPSLFVIISFSQIFTLLIEYKRILEIGRRMSWTLHERCGDPILHTLMETLYYTVFRIKYPNWKFKLRTSKQ